ncbi:uncharacterized protein LOC123206320 [Mangifera indica]|uniref:uncharacterized protein LOC123206320 n=1 Tax=Mangifera indica TaxID=29780 RepID=UPI001CFB924F|nr:uncharacterized protein LOC123206320 [Mangifera indica]
MANHLTLLLLITTTAVILAAEKPPTTIPTSPPISIPPLQQENPNHQHTTISNPQQLNNIIDALIGAGDFHNWADILSGAVDSAMFPLSATFFIPTKDLPPNLQMDPFTFAYHVVPQRLTFSDLCLLKPLSRLPTLLPTKSILVTNNSVSNFTLDDSLLSEPDFYLTSTISVHGVYNFLDYSVYGGNYTPFLPEHSPPPPPHRRHARRPFVPTQEEIQRGHGGGKRSDAACLWWEFHVVFGGLFVGLLGFKIF